MPITESNADDVYGSIPTVDPETAGRGHRPVEGGGGANQTYTITEAEAHNPSTRTPVPSYRPDTPQGT